MCNSPSLLPNGQTVSCRKCKRCMDNRVKDWVGRCIAESKTAVATHSITLTYAPKGGVDRHERAAVLTYSDVQKWFKKLRTAGYPVRFLACGEYGKKKGRAHWHVIVFWQDRVPEHKLRENFNGAFWDHGHSFWDDPDYKAVRYVVKYLHKDMSDEAAQSKMTCSKVPPLGAHYFAQLAKRYVDQGIPPRGPFYRFPEAKKSTDGKPHEFMMRGVTADNFAAAYVAAFELAKPGQHIPPCPWIEEWLDKQEKDWQLERDILKLEAVAKAAKVLQQSEDREAFRRAHDLYYFGQGRVGLYDVDWEPNGEKEIEEFEQDNLYYILNSPEFRSGCNSLEGQYWSFGGLEGRY